MPDEFVPDDDLLPCGCLIRYAIINGERTMTISPCHQDCRNLANALSIGRELGKNIEYRRA